MSEYLARLKAIKNEKNPGLATVKTVKSPCHPPFDGFDGARLGAFPEKNQPCELPPKPSKVENLDRGMPFVAAASPTENSRPPIDLASFAERSAIMEYDGGMPRLDAENAAAQEMGFDSAGALYHAVIEAWLAEIEAAPETKLLGFDKLRAFSLRFLASEWPMKALAAGWCEIGLFGVHECAAPRERLDAQGLVPLIAWGMLGCTILGLDRHAAALRTRQGSTLHQPRMRANFDAALVWWAHPAIHGHKNERA
jgi:hypothetical protein